MISIMSNLRCRFRQAFACVLTAGMVAGGVNLTMLPVSAEELDSTSIVIDGTTVSMAAYMDEAVQAVKDQISALPAPDTIMAQTAEEQAESYEQVQAAAAAYEQLTEEQKLQLEGAEETLATLLGCFPDVGMAVAESEVTTEEQVIAYADVDTSHMGNFGSGKLSGVNLRVYDYLKAGIRQVADGSRTSTAFDVSPVVNNSAEANEVGANLDLIVSYLLMDCPYDLFWHDKTAGTGYTMTSAGNEATVIISMTVSNAYRADSLANEGDTWKYTVDTNKVTAAQAVTATAQQIVNVNAGKSDYDKLLAYKNAICDSVSYNNSAKNPESSNANAWELIWVFDDDPDTNVVCEGYSKAFQYLCDLSQFKNAKCYTVSGSMAGGTGAGAHMWNIVSMDGKNYLVDVTNCDTGTIGAPDKLFLAVPDSGTWNTKYLFHANKDVEYVYDSRDGSGMEELFGKDILKLTGDSSKDPTPTPTPTPDPGVEENPEGSKNPDNSKNPNDTEKPGTTDKTTGSTTTKKSVLRAESLDPSDTNEYKLVREDSLKTTPELIAIDSEFADVSKLESAMKDELAESHTISASNIRVYEITLQIKDENGNWVDATTENFPKKGIKITMSYPAGTNKSGYTFYGQHLFTKNMNGYAAGTLEDLTISKENDGISFAVHGLSPVSIGWKNANADTANPSATKTTSPKTGDDSSALLYLVLMMLAVGAGSISARRLRFAER